MADMKTGATYGVEPGVLTTVSSMLQETLKYQSLAMMNIPTSFEVTPYQQHYEWPQKDYDTEIDYKLEVHDDDGVSESLKKNERPIPAIFFNKKLDYDAYRREQDSIYTLNERLQDHIGQMALRNDLITYRGDSVTQTDYGIDDLISATPGTEFSTALDVSTTALTATTMEAAIQQLKQAGKYSGIIGPNSTVIMEVTPNLWTETAVVSTNEDFNARTVINRALQDNFSAQSRVVENWTLDATVTYTGKKHSISIGTNNKALMYVQDPRVMKIVASPMEIRQDLFQTSGLTVQPVMRTRRIDVEAALVLVETAATVS